MNIKIIINQMRCYQWVKNLLIFLPVVLSGIQISAELLLYATIAFFSFSFVASSVYTFNDILDVNSDRLHFYKKNRPIASKNISIKSAYLLLFALMLLGISLGFQVSIKFIYILVAYLFFNILYTLFFKKFIIIDIIFLTLFYVLRVIGGSFIIIIFDENILISEWLLSFTIFFFFSLGSLKRYIDISLIPKELSNYKKERGYTLDDKRFIQTIGISSGMISSLIIVLYTGSDSVSFLFSFPIVIVSSVPAFIYWFTRLWYLGSKGEIKNDPIKYTIKDVTSYIVFIYLILVFVLAKSL